MRNTDTEKIILVDKEGNKIGGGPKLASHHKDTPLHLAFSVYIFNNKGQVLASQRALHKKVWPSVWTNSCCGHLSPGETTEQAIIRRVKEELGLSLKELRAVLPDYRYKTPPYNGIIENEICPVYFAMADSDLDINPDEVEDTKWMDWDEFKRQAESDKDNRWSWWCKDQLKEFEALAKSEWENILANYQ